jgi:hypothetical protein
MTDGDWLADKKARTGHDRHSFDKAAKTYRKSRVCKNHDLQTV